jgi:hypothetical protein
LARVVVLGFAEVSTSDFSFFSVLVVRVEALAVAELLRRAGLVSVSWLAVAAFSGLERVERLLVGVAFACS